MGGYPIILRGIKNNEYYLSRWYSNKGKTYSSLIREDYYIRKIFNKIFKKWFENLSSIIIYRLNNLSSVYSQLNAEIRYYASKKAFRNFEFILRKLSRKKFDLYSKIILFLDLKHYKRCFNNKKLQIIKFKLKKNENIKHFLQKKKIFKFYKKLYSYHMSHLIRIIKKLSIRNYDLHIFFNIITTLKILWQLSVNKKLNITFKYIWQNFREPSFVIKLIASLIKDRVRLPLLFSTIFDYVGFRGIKIRISGRYTGKDRAQSIYVVNKNLLSIQTIRESIIYFSGILKTYYGVIGIKVWLKKNLYWYY